MELLYKQAAARITKVTRSLEAPFGRLTCIIDYPTSSYNVYGTIDNKNVRRNRIGQNIEFEYIRLAVVAVKQI